MAGLWRRYHPRAFVRKILQIDDTPHSIALGTSLGMLIGMTPTVGIQIIIAALVCTAVRANRIAGIITVFVSNPLTMVPIYWADYWLGAKLLGAEKISKEDFAAIWGRIANAGMIGGIREAFTVLTGEIFIPMMLGGTLIGLVLAIPLYPVTYRAAAARRRRRDLRRAYLRLRELRATGGDDPLAARSPGRGGPVATESPAVVVQERAPEPPGPVPGPAGPLSSTEREESLR